MSQLIVNNLHQPDVAPLNGVALKGEQAGAPAGLGNNHSVGQTIGRIVLAILSLGITEVVLAIIRAVKAELGPAVPHLPQNRALSPQGRIMVEQGKNKAFAALGEFCTVDGEAFQKKLEAAVLDAFEYEDDATLENLAEQTARALLVKSLVKTALKDDPKGATLPLKQKTDLSPHLLRTEQAKALVRAPNAEAAAGLVATVKDMVSEHLRSLADRAAINHELLSTGLQSFRDATGLSEEQAASLNTGSLQDKMNLIRTDLDQHAGTAERPYAKVGRDTLFAKLKPRAERFFADRAEAYNSIATIDVPDGLKTTLRNTCMKAWEGFPGKSFTVVAEVGQGMAKLPLWDGLTNPELTVNEKLNSLHDMAQSIQSLLENSFGKEQFAEIGLDSQAFMIEILYEFILGVKPQILVSLRDNPNQVKELQAGIQERTDQANDYDTKETTEGKKTKEMMQAKARVTDGVLSRILAFLN